MAGSTEMLAAFRELTTAKQLERSDLLELLRDGIQAALVRKFGPNVKFELSVDELQGTIKVVRLRQVVETIEDPSWQIALEEARYEDPDYFSVTRNPEHQAFGAGGRHFCLGTALARLELRTLFEETLKRYPQIEIAGTPAYVESPFVNQLKTLPVRLGPLAA